MDCEYPFDSNCRKRESYEKEKTKQSLYVLLMMVAAMVLLSGCGGKRAEKEDADTLTVYLWSTSLYEKYAPYIQEQLPDINIEFVVAIMIWISTGF